MKAKSETKKKAEQSPNLIKVIVKDLLFERWLLVLLIILTTVSSVAVTWSTQKNREMNAELSSLIEDRSTASVDWRKLRLEYRALAEHSRIEQLAREKLNMHPVTADKETVIR